MSGIQLPVGIDTVNPVPADYKYGPYANLSAAKSAIPQALRYDGMTVQITGLGNYWWLQSDLTDTGLLAKTGGSTIAALAKVRYVYLIQDAADVTTMGGTSNNVYSTFQTAYDAAVALQIIAGGKVVIQVGNTSAVTVGNMVTAAAWSLNISMVGINSAVSAVGTITINNTAGISTIRMDKITTGDITLSTQANIVINDCIIGNITPTKKFASGLMIFQGNNNTIGTIVDSSTTSTLPAPLSFNTLYNSKIGDITMSTTISAGSNISVTNCFNLIFGNVLMNNTSTTGVFSIGSMILTSSKNISFGTFTQTMASNNNTGAIAGLSIDYTNQNIYFGGTVSISAYNANTSSDAVITSFVINNTFFITDVLINASNVTSVSAAAKGGRIDNVDINNCQFNARTAFFNNTTTPYTGAGNNCLIRNTSFVKRGGLSGLVFCIENVSMNLFKISRCTVDDPSNLFGLTITSLGVAQQPYLKNTATNSIILDDIISSSITINYYGSAVVKPVPDIKLTKVISPVISFLFNTVNCYYSMISSSSDNFNATDVNALGSGADSIIDVSRITMNQASNGMPTKVRLSYIQGSLADSISYTFHAYSSTLDFSNSSGTLYILAGDFNTSNFIRYTTSVSTMTNNNSFEQLI